MTPEEYIELLKYIREKLNDFNNIDVGNIVTNYSPKFDKIWGIGARVTIIDSDNRKVKLFSFVNDECNMDNIKKWLDSLCEWRGKEWQ